VVEFVEAEVVVPVWLVVKVGEADWKEVSFNCF
jgi:hypothetical protein